MCFTIITLVALTHAAGSLVKLVILLLELVLFMLLPYRIFCRIFCRILLCYYLAGVFLARLSSIFLGGAPPWGRGP